MVNVQSSGFAVGPAERGTDYSGFGKIVGGLAQSALYDEEKDPRAQQARLYGAQADRAESGNQGIQVLANTIDGMAARIRENPDMAAETFKEFAGNIASNAIRADYDPQDLARMMLSFAGTSQMDNATQMNFRSGAGLSPLGKDQALTQDRQDQIRSENFGQQVQIEGMREAGKDRRGTGRGGSGKSGKPLGLVDMQRLNQEIGRQMGLSSENMKGVDNQMLTDIRLEASAQIEAGASPALAVADSISKLTQFNAGDEGKWYIPFDSTEESYSRREGSAPAAAPTPSGQGRVRRFNPATGRLE